ncbi:unnamed protein product, partial [Scytosiphon promiscuus]
SAFFYQASSLTTAVTRTTWRFVGFSDFPCASFCRQVGRRSVVLPTLFHVRGIKFCRGLRNCAQNVVKSRTAKECDVFEFGQRLLLAGSCRLEALVESWHTYTEMDTLRM